MKTTVLLLAFAAALVTSAGAVGLGWGINMNMFGHAHGQINASYAQHGEVNSSYVWGWNYQNMTYNKTQVNRTTVLKQIATVAQCRTNFVDSAAPIASSALNVSLNTTSVNSANARLQSDISSNASDLTLRGDVMVFDGYIVRLFGQATGKAKGLNQTQLQSLRVQLNGSVTTLQACTSGNPLGKWFLGFRLGFMRGYAGFRTWMGGFFHGRLGR